MHPLAGSSGIPMYPLAGSSGIPMHPLLPTAVSMSHAALQIPSLEDVKTPLASYQAPVGQRRAVKGKEEEEEDANVTLQAEASGHLVGGGGGGGRPYQTEQPKLLLAASETVAPCPEKRPLGEREGGRKGRRGRENGDMLPCVVLSSLQPPPTIPPMATTRRRKCMRPRPFSLHVDSPQATVRRRASAAPVWCSDCVLLVVISVSHFPNHCLFCNFSISCENNFNFVVIHWWGIISVNHKYS